MKGGHIYQVLDLLSSILHYFINYLSFISAMNIILAPQNIILFQNSLKNVDPFQGLGMILEHTSSPQSLV